MKKILFAMTAIALMASGCNKCYDCRNQYGSEEICKDDFRYESLKKGQNITDYQGADYTCTVK